MNNKFCHLPFKSVYLTGNYINDDGRTMTEVSSCCTQVTSTVDITDNFDSIYETLEETQNQFLSGEMPSSCNNCWKLEEKGIKSMRQHTLPYLDNTHYINFEDLPHLNELISESKIKIIDVEYTSKCNLACRSCNGNTSTLWRKEASKIDLLDLQELYGGDNDKAVSGADRLYEFVKEHLPNLERIEFEGGEPTLEPYFYKTIEYIKDNKYNPSISFTTNATRMPNSIIKSGLNIQAVLSIDGTGSVYEYLRWPAKWDRVKKNSLKIPLPMIQEVNAVLTPYNLFNLKELYETFPGYKIRLISSLNQNEYMSIQYLPYELIMEAAREFDKLEHKWKFEAIDILYKLAEYSKHIDEEQRAPKLRMLKRSTSSIDRSRNVHYRDYIDPRISDFLDTLIE